jgi:hypothetical protein
VRTAKFDAGGWDTAAPASGRQQAFGWDRIGYAFFSGGPFAFRVDVKPDNADLKRPLVLLFGWRGDWKLTRVFVPATPAPGAAQVSPSPPRAAASKPQLPPAQPSTLRAVLFEEDPSDPQGKSYAGTVSWRVEQIPPASGGAPQVAAAAHVSIPGRPLGLTMTIRRNFDQTLPASHTIEVKFDLPPDSKSGGVQDVAGILMKASEEETGPQLAGSRVKVRDDFFLLGLSAIDTDVRQNIQLLSDRPWFGIPFASNSRNRAVLAIEKGEDGAKSIAQALPAPAASPAASPAVSPAAAASGGQQR